MSREFNKIDTGTLGENRYKERDNQPDMTGKLEAMSAEVIAAIAAGKPVRLAGWWKESANGQFLSLKVSVMRERTETQGASEAGEQKSWPTASGQQRATGSGPVRARPKPGTIEGNLAASSEDPNDEIPFAFAIAVPALALIVAAIHHTGGLIA